MMVRSGALGGEAVKIDRAGVIQLDAAAARHSRAQPVRAGVEERRDA